MMVRCGQHSFNRFIMFKTILRATASTAKRFLVVWLIILLANQVFIFGGCFALYCLAAALPHTIALAVLVNFFGFKRDESAKKSYSSTYPGNSSDAHTRSNLSPSSKSVPSAQRKYKLRHIVFLALILVGVFLSFKFFTRSEAPENYSSASKENVKPAVDERPSIEVTDDPAPPADVQAKRIAYLETDVEVPGERTNLEQDGGDEFDINDIEQYERLNNRKYRGTTAYTSDEISSVVNAAGLDHVENRSEAAPIQVRETVNRPEDSAAAHQAYKCLSSTGRLGIGTGRPSRGGEYSSFLNREVRAKEFVIFKYEGSGKEYWFKNSNCTRI